MRFAGARTEGLAEAEVERIADGYDDAGLPPEEVAALHLTDAIVGEPRALDADQVAELRKHFSDPQVVELALGVGLFLGLSKALIALGLEPESMPVSVIPTPGTAA